MTGPAAPQGAQASQLKLAMKSMRGAFWAAALLSLAINILMLTGPLFMLQVYDRVLASGSVPTLAAIFGLVAGLYVFMGVFDFLRTRVLSRVGYALDDRLGGLALRGWILHGLAGPERPGRPLTDLTTLRQFLGSSALPAIFDIPWVPFYLAIVFALHTKLGLLAAIGALLVVMIAIVTESVTRVLAAEASRLELQELQFADDSHRMAEAIVAMGMTGNIVAQWADLRGSAGLRAQRAAERGEGLAATSKAFRMLLQSAILALGAYLAIQHEISGGTIIAASILAGRALSPIDQTIGSWRSIERARHAYMRLSAHFKSAAVPQMHVALPRPDGTLVVERVVKNAPGRRANSGTHRPILQNISFTLAPGDGLGVIGPSASGKSTLARILAGVWSPDHGSVRLDGATHDQWNSDQLGPHIGYLPQTVELISGSIRQNICRFAQDAKDEDIIAAARLAGVHDIILNLADGYATKIGSSRPPLSGGQAQRVALARAVYGVPSLVILDEPSSNLDAEGDIALTRAIERLRAAGSIVIVMTHRPGAIAAVNQILMLAEGRQVEFGEKADILRKITRTA